jgi:outer membrane murein-binding lipoprotein Lpp
MKIIIPFVAVIAFALAGCSAQAPAPETQVQANLAKSVDCSTAASDIKTLNSEKARTSQEIEDGASSIIPIGAVAHLFGGSEKESMEIGTGEYNKKLDAKIAEIQQQCDMQ